ncbi:hypothetical protein K8R47_03430, partial [archaeon]|nr:hypothetical protein [archaeon]
VVNMEFDKYVNRLITSFYGIFVLMSIGLTAQGISGKLANVHENTPATISQYLNINSRYLNTNTNSRNTIENTLKIDSTMEEDSTSEFKILYDLPN